MAMGSKSTFLTSWFLSTCLHLLCMHEPAASASIDKQILDAAPQAEMFDFLHIMPKGEAMVMTELDLLLTLEQYKLLYHAPSSSREKRKAVRDTKTRWTGCKVYYEITESLNTTENRGIIKEAMREWEKYTCLEFIESRSATRRIQFMDGGGCYSQLGMQKEPQPIALAPGCRTKGIIAHEIGHAIGWYHEHMRPDRDEYITVNFDVIPQIYHRNFEKYNSSVVYTYNISYDYNSIMHYGNQAIRGSITTLDPDYQNTIGQRQGFTFKDIKLANVMYSCAEVMGCPNKDCERNGFVFYKNYKNKGKCSCWCDSGNVNDPLVVCSEMDKEPPTPNPRPTSLPVIKECYDVREDCGQLKNQDKNVCINKMKMMMASCAKTCDFCGKGKGVCMDYEKGCPVLAASGACTDKDMIETMKKLCPASCRFCTPTDPCSMQNELMAPAAGRNVISKMSSSWACSYILALFSLILKQWWLSRVY